MLAGAQCVSIALLAVRRAMCYVLCGAALRDQRLRALHLRPLMVASLEAQEKRKQTRRSEEERVVGDARDDDGEGVQRTLSSNVCEKMAPRASGSLIAEGDDPLATTHCHASTHAKASWLYFETLFRVPLASYNIFFRSARHWSLLRLSFVSPNSHHGRAPQGSSCYQCRPWRLIFRLVKTLQTYRASGRLQG